MKNARLFARQLDLTIVRSLQPLLFLVAVLLSGVVVNAQDQNTPPANDPQPAADKSEGSGLPLISDMKLPSADELLTRDPLDWIVLKNDEVLVTQPIYPRPATLEKLATALGITLEQMA